MSWFRERGKPSWFHQFCTRVLKAGPIPNHVAIIMDGNRRFAVKNSMDKANGHLKGFDKLTETLEWCLDLGILEVTVYAFSIENFKRSKEEVECLMELSRKKFARLMEEKALLDKHGVCIRVLGDLLLLPLDIQKTIADAVIYTSKNKRATLNVCFSYTSREEICAAMKETIEGAQKGHIRESDIREDVLENCLYTVPSVCPDLLIRTSGEVRLSDFLLWQSSYSVLSFVKVLWPDFSRWHLYAAVLHYQKNFQQVQEAKERYREDKIRLDEDWDKNCVLAEMTNRRGSDNDILFEQDKLTTYTQFRKQRIYGFLQHVKKKRLKSLELMLNQSK